MSRVRRPEVAPAWSAVVALGTVSLAADMVYEGLRSVTGPLLASLGAGAALVGLTTGLGEGLALLLRLAAGRWADRTGRHWAAALLGYGLTAVAVPLLGVAVLLGRVAPAGVALGLAVALVLAERTGKAIRSPSKSVLLAHAARDVGRGRGFGVHKALDQVGAFAGPLLLAALAALTGAFWPGLLLLGVPGAIAIALLVRLRRERPDLQEGAPRVAGPDAGADAGPDAGPIEPAASPRLPRRFHLAALATSLSTAGLLTFGLLSFRLVDEGLLPAAGIPLVYAGAMAVEAVAALALGPVYDRVGARSLVGLPVLVAVVPALTLLAPLPLALLGLVVWAAATGLQDSTVKAMVADLVPSARLGTAYGAFATYQGLAALAGGALGGLLYDGHRAALVVGVAVLQVPALAGLAVLTRRSVSSSQVSSSQESR